MITNNLYKRIVRNTELVDIFAEYYNFEIVEPTTNSYDYHFKANEEVTIIAQDASGGTFALFGSGDDETLPVVYISSEGQAGIVGKNFEQFIKIMIECPYWIDLLKFSGNGQLHEMLKVRPFLIDDTLEDFPEIMSVKEKVLSILSLKEIVNPVESLYESMISKHDVGISSLENEKFESLFNSFVATDNPLWKRKIQ